MGFFPTDVGAQLGLRVGVVPEDAAAGTLEGDAIDRDGFLSGVLFVSASADAIEDAYLEHSDDDSSGWEKLEDETRRVADEGVVRVDYNLKGAQRYIRAVVVTNDAAVASASVVLGGAVTKPAE